MHPIVFNIRHTPYRLPKGATENEIASHASERNFYNMTSERNIFSYITQDKKIGESATFLDYLQKSTGVFNNKGTLTDTEVKEMKKRLKENEGNLWHGFISLHEEDSEKLDTPEKGITLCKVVFEKFFKEIGLDKDNIDLMCALHLDQKHMHIHFLFWEKEPKYKNSKGEIKYKSRGVVPKRAIDNAIIRMQLHYSGNDIEVKETRQEALKSLKNCTNAKILNIYKNEVKEKIIKLANKIPKDQNIGYANKEMQPYRKAIDGIVKMILSQDKQARKSNREFYKGLEKRRSIIDSINKSENNVDTVSMKKAIEKIEEDYRRRQGNTVINFARIIDVEKYERKKKKYKACDKSLRINLSISKRKRAALFEKFLMSFTMESKTLEEWQRSRLEEIEDEIERENKKKEKEENYKY